MTMNESKIIKNWDSIRQILKQEYQYLTENDLTYVEGKEEELFDNLQKKLEYPEKN